MKYYYYYYFDDTDGTMIALAVEGMAEALNAPMIPVFNWNAGSISANSQQYLQ